MKTIIVSAAAWADTQKRLQASTEESCAVFLTRPGATSDAILVEPSFPFRMTLNSKRSPVGAELKAAFLFDATERARLEQSAQRIRRPKGSRDFPMPTMPAKLYSKRIWI